MEADAEVFTQLGIGPAGPDQRCPIVFHGRVHDATLGHPAADDSLDAVLGHEIQRSLGAALDGLPALYGQVSRARDQSDFRQFVAPVGYVGRDVVVLAVVGERPFVESLEYYVYLLLEQLPVGRLIQQWVSKGLNFPGVVASADAKNNPPAGQDIRGGIVLSQTQRMPHGSDVERTAQLDVFGQVSQVDLKHQ